MRGPPWNRFRRPIDPAQPPIDESPADQAVPRRGPGVPRGAREAARHRRRELATTLGRTDTSADSEAEHVRECREWQATLADNGWAGIAWPKEYGGRGGTPGQARIFAQEEHSFVVSSGAFAVAIGMVGPTIIAHGTEEQKEYYLPRMLNGEHIWCQLFSEPGAGSDLAGPRDPRRSTTATSGSSTARRCGPPARTSATGASSSPAPTGTCPKHRGITLLPRRHALPRHRDPAAAPDHRVSRTSTRCSSPTCASRPRTCSGR